MRQIRGGSHTVSTDHGVWLLEHFLQSQWIDDDSHRREDRNLINQKVKIGINRCFVQYVSDLDKVLANQVCMLAAGSLPLNNEKR